MMRFLKPFVYQAPLTVAAVFRGHNLFWLIAGALATLLSVSSGFDWWWFTNTRHALVFNFFIGAGLVGFLVPVIVPIIAFVIGRMRRDGKLVNAGYALAQSGALAWLASSFLKFFTGRTHPLLWGSPASSDISRVFHFGFGDGGIFWGWPSSHATVACAIAATAIVLYAKSARVRTLWSIFALYIVLGVSLTFHWFSDALAGAILGTIVGLAVGSSFAARTITDSSSSAL